MASDEFLRFLEALLVDEDLRARFASLEADGVQESIAAMVELGGRAGFRFDGRDVARVIGDARARVTETVGPELLSTGELEIVAGGRSGERGAPVVALPGGGGRTILAGTPDFHRLLLAVREALEREGASTALLEGVLAAETES